MGRIGRSTAGARMLIFDRAVPHGVEALGESAFLLAIATRIVCPISETISCGQAHCGALRSARS
jgi:hypothetical protein